MFQDPADSVTARVRHLHQQIPSQVRLIAVSKQVTSDKIREAYAAGIRDFGESRVQEAIPKQVELQELTDITWHFIGRLQANKARKVLEHFHWIHSVDNLKLAERLNALAQELQRSPNICLQLKLLEDANKLGWCEGKLWEDLPRLSQLTALKIQGLMTIPPLGLTEAELQKLFQDTQKLLRRINHQSTLHLPLRELSLGMSDDYQIAIANGSTMVRLGTIVFGER